MSEDRADLSAGTPQWTCLDLFCGLGGFSAALVESEDWEVVTVDIEEEFDPDICADVFDLRPSDFDRNFDVVLASPPCTCFSTATRKYHFDDSWRPETEFAADSVALVHHTIGLVQALSPDYWLLENPVGYLTRFIDEPEGIVHYCRYGIDAKKPTALWGEHPPLDYLKCNHESHDRDLDSEMQLEQSKQDYAERAKVPYELSKSIRTAVEEAFRNPPPEQSQLPVAAPDGGEHG